MKWSRLELGCALSLMIMAAMACDGGSNNSTGSAGSAGDIASTGGSSAGGGGSSPTGGAGGGGGTVPVTPTISTWMGTNVSADLPYVDITRQLNGFDSPSKDANGYPAAGASGTSQTDIGFVLPTGTYNISYKGTGALQVSGIGKLSGSFAEVSGEQRAQLQITGTPGSFGQFLTLTVNNGPGQSVTDIHILLPGIDYDSPQVFNPAFLGVLKPFRALRFMDWLATNGNNIVDWKDRPVASAFGKSPYGEPYEDILELVNQTGKDAWITIGEHASDDYIHSFAKFMATGLDFSRIDDARKKQGFATPFKLFVEDSNETWNQGFSAFKTHLDAANADPARYTGVYTGTYGPDWQAGLPDLMKVGQYEADRLVKIAKIFREELGAKADIVSPVLSGWALGAVYSDVGLRFIKDNYGDPKQFVAAVAIAPYFGVDDAATGSLDSLFGAAVQNIDAMEPAFQDFAKLRDEYGLQLVAYEGGQGITGATNQQIKHLAQHDQRMYDTYSHYFALWKKVFGESLFMHFSLAGIPGLPENIYQYGYWGSILGVEEDTAACMPNLPTLTGNEAIDTVVHHCPKYRALREQAP